MAASESKPLLEAAASAASAEEARGLAGQAVLAELSRAMREAGITKAEQSVAAINAAGLGPLLARALAEGRVKLSWVDAELDRFRKALVRRDLSAQDIKLGILAFDECAQRLSLVAGKTGGFDYPSSGNRARDSLITFARSLHR
jgi:hypothetical protein